MLWRAFIGICCCVTCLSAPAGAGEASRRAAAAPSEPARLYTRERTWIWSAPGKGRRLGYARAGQMLSAAGESVDGPGCRGRYVPVEPRGFVCHDDDATTRDAADRAYRVAQLLAPSPTAHLFQYVISNGAPMYRRLPTPDEWARAERDLGPIGHYEKYPWNEKHERLAEERVVRAGGAVPFFLRDGGSARAKSESELVRMIAPLGTMLAYVRSFAHADRTWLLMTDGTAVPADRVRPYRASEFTGVVLRGRDALPVAWARRPAVPLWVEAREAEGGWARRGGTLALRERVRLADVAHEPTRSGQQRMVALDGAEGRYVDVADLFVARAEPKPASVGEGDRWIHVSVGGGTLVAYEGDRPVFATLISPGAGGVDRPGADPVKASTTPRGRYRIQYKYRSQTMSPQKDKPDTQRTFWIADVPHAQYFRIPFALHASYWHEDFGRPMSGGCVNLSPRDALWLFHFTGPALPPGWEAVWAGGDNGRGTFVLVTR